MTKKSRPEVRSRYTQFDHGGISFEDPTLTKQSFKEECDVNSVMRKFQATGVHPNFNPIDPIYGDFSDVNDYQTSLNLVLHANAQFEGLPAAVRDRFQNDPSQFLQFAADPKNGREMVKLGLAVERPNLVSPSSQPASIEPEGRQAQPGGSAKPKVDPVP